MNLLQHIGKQMTIIITVTAVLLLASQVVLANNKVEPDCPASFGELNLTIVAGSTSTSEELPLENCVQPLVSLTAGSGLDTPIVTNAWVHHGKVVVTAYLLQAQSGPVDVIVWWQVDNK